MNLAESIIKNSKLALTRAKLRSMHSELSYGLSFAPKLQRVGTMSLSGSHQPTPDPSFSLMLPSQALLLLCHLDNDLVIIHTTIYIYGSSVPSTSWVDIFLFK